MNWQFEASFFQRVSLWLPYRLRVRSREHFFLGACLVPHPMTWHRDYMGRRAPLVITNAISHETCAAADDPYNTIPIVEKWAFSRCDRDEMLSSLKSSKYTIRTQIYSNCKCSSLINRNHKWKFLSCIYSKCLVKTEQRYILFSIVTNEITRFTVIIRIKHVSKANKFVLKNCYRTRRLRKRP